MRTSLILFVITLIVSQASFSYSRLTLAVAKENAQTIESCSKKIDSFREQNITIESKNTIVKRYIESLNSLTHFMTDIPEYLTRHNNIENILELRDLAWICHDGHPEEFARAYPEFMNDVAACQCASRHTLKALFSYSLVNKHFVEFALQALYPLMGMQGLYLALESAVASFSVFKLCDFLWKRLRPTHPQMEAKVVSAKPESKKPKKLKKLKQRPPRRKHVSKDSEPTLEDIQAAIPKAPAVFGEYVEAAVSDYSTQELETARDIREARERIRAAAAASAGPLQNRRAELYRIILETQNLIEAIRIGKRRLHEDHERELSKLKGLIHHADVD